MSEDLSTHVYFFVNVEIASNYNIICLWYDIIVCETGKSHLTGRKGRIVDLSVRISSLERVSITQLVVTR